MLRNRSHSHQHSLCTYYQRYQHRCHQHKTGRISYSRDRLRNRRHFRKSDNDRQRCHKLSRSRRTLDIADWQRLCIHRVRSLLNIWSSHTQGSSLSSCFACISSIKNQGVRNSEHSDHDRLCKGCRLDPHRNHPDIMRGTDSHHRCHGNKLFQ